MALSYTGTEINNFLYLSMMPSVDDAHTALPQHTLTWNRYENVAFWSHLLFINWLTYSPSQQSLISERERRILQVLMQFMFLIFMNQNLIVVFPGISLQRLEIR